MTSNEYADSVAHELRGCSRRTFLAFQKHLAIECNLTQESHLSNSVSQMQHTRCKTLKNQQDATAKDLGNEAMNYSSYNIKHCE